MSSPAEFTRLGDDWNCMFGRLRQRDLLNSVPALSTRNLRAKPKKFVSICDHHSPTYRSQPGNRIHRSTDSFLPHATAFLIRGFAAQLTQPGKGWKDCVQNGTHDRFPP